MSTVVCYWLANFLRPKTAQNLERLHKAKYEFKKYTIPELPLFYNMLKLWNFKKITLKIQFIHIFITWPLTHCSILSTNKMWNIFMDDLPSGQPAAWFASPCFTLRDRLMIYVYPEGILAMSFGFSDFILTEK